MSPGEVAKYAAGILDEILTPDLTFKTQACRMLFEAWHAWRSESLLPKHTDVDPNELKSVLPQIGILEIRARDSAVFRLAGSGLRDIVGLDLTGRDTIALSPPRYRRQRAYRLYTPVVWPCAYHGESRYTYSTDSTDVCESVGLPLEPDSPEIHGMIIFALDSILGRRWRNVPAPLIDTTSDVFRFVDIGAGIPASIDPPDDFLAD
jgi:hypothetical protein